MGKTSDSTVKTSVAGPADPQCDWCTLVREGELDGSIQFLYVSKLWTVNHRSSMAGTHWRGWLVVQPRRHVTRWGDFTPGELHEMSKLFPEVERVMLAATVADRVFIASLGASADTHVHLHFVPFFEEGPASPDIFHGLPTNGELPADIQHMRPIVLPG